VTVIPLLPCKSLSEILNFYRALGFEVTYAQDAPYAYASVRHGDFQLHFSHLTVYGAKNAFGACLVFVPDVSVYHQRFSDALGETYGKIPTSGVPRLTRFKKEHTRFKVFDPSGNVLIYINQNEPEMDYGESGEVLSDLGRALDNAIFLRDTYSNDKAAAHALDIALKRNPTANPLERARALAARAELAVAMGEREQAQTFKDELKRIELSEADRVRYRDELHAADVLERWIGQIRD
jgi:hypothetical protein